jgi:hypothetical protein
MSSPRHCTAIRGYAGGVASLPVVARGVRQRAIEQRIRSACAARAGEACYAESLAGRFQIQERERHVLRLLDDYGLMPPSPDVFGAPASSGVGTAFVGPLFGSVAAPAALHPLSGAICKTTLSQ